MGKLKSLFIAATRQNDGKTLVSLGLLHVFQKRFHSVSYMKPVGQDYKVINNNKIDKDAVLFRDIYHLHDDHIYMSPIAVAQGFTEAYLHNGNKKDLEKKITTSFSHLSKGKEFMLIEGTGHAGVGSVFDMSNAEVAHLLGTKVILVSLGGIGRCIDEIMLNKALFDLKGVELIGVIINKVKQEKYEKISQLVRQGLERHRIRVLGVIPFVNLLTKPTVAELFEDLDAELLSGKEGLSNLVEKFVIGDMLPHDALDAFSINTLLIVPANQEGLIMTALCGNMLGTKVIYYVSGIIFSGGIKPHPKIMNLIKHTQIPLLAVKDDSFTVASRINNMLVKLRAEESEKIRLAQALVEKHVDVDTICELL